MATSPRKTTARKMAPSQPGKSPAGKTVLVLDGPNLNLLGTRVPNVHAREPFRHHSCFTGKAVGTIVGLGPRGCEFAPAYAVARLKG